MKTLEEIFADGHRLARSKAPKRNVARCPKPPAEEGEWWIKAEAVPAVAMRHEVDPDDVEGELTDALKQEKTWRVNEELCWCTKCSMNRKLLETHDE